MTPLSLCILCGTEILLMAHFPLLAPTSSPLIQSGSKLWPKSANGSLAPKGIGQSRSNHYSSSVNSPILVVVTVTLAGAMEMGIVLMADVVLSPGCSTNRSVLCVLKLRLELLQSLLLFKLGSLHFPSVLWDTLYPSNTFASCFIWP